jgi:hypothetical protein
LTSRALALALALSLAGAACMPAHTVISREPEPGATVRAIRAQALDRQHADLSIDLEIDNPGAALDIGSADFEILLSGRSFANGTTKLTLHVQASGRAALTLPVQLAYLDLPAPARAGLQQGRSLHLAARGVLRGSTGAADAVVQFDGEGELAATADAELP